MTHVNIWKRCGISSGDNPKVERSRSQGHLTPADLCDVEHVIDQMREVPDLTFDHAANGRALAARPQQLRPLRIGASGPRSS